MAPSPSLSFPLRSKWTIKYPRQHLQDGRHLIQQMWASDKSTAQRCHFSLQRNIIKKTLLWNCHLYKAWRHYKKDWGVNSNSNTDLLRPGHTETHAGNTQRSATALTWSLIISWWLSIINSNLSHLALRLLTVSTPLPDTVRKSLFLSSACWNKGKTWGLKEATDDFISPSRFHYFDCYFMIFILKWNKILNGFCF